VQSACLFCLLFRLLAKQAKKYEKQKTKEDREKKELAEAESKSKVARFVKTEKSILSSSAKAFKDNEKQNGWLVIDFESSL